MKDKASLSIALELYSQPQALVLLFVYSASKIVVGSGIVNLQILVLLWSAAAGQQVWVMIWSVKPETNCSPALQYYTRKPQMLVMLFVLSCYAVV